MEPLVSMEYEYQLQGIRIIMSLYTVHDQVPKARDLQTVQQHVYFY